MVEQGKPLAVFFDADFVQTDQEVSDLSAPKPETTWCLVELGKEELGALQGGQSFFFKERSSEGGCAALCTDTATFALEFLENSNSIFIASMSEASASTASASTASSSTSSVDSAGAATNLGRCTIFAQCRGQIILKPSKMDRQKVYELLLPHILSANKEAEDIQPVTTARLVHEVAASPKELKELLQDGPYVEHQGRWRLLPKDLEQEVLHVTDTLVTAHRLDCEAVDAVELLSQVQEQLGDGGEVAMPSAAVLQKALRNILTDDALAEYAAAPTEAQESASAAKPVSSSRSTFRLDKTKMSRARAAKLLQDPPTQVRERFGLVVTEPRAKKTRGPTGSSALLLSEFVAAFRELSPDMGEMSAEDILSILGNNVYVDVLEGTVHALDSSTLPQDPKERLSRLFALQTHWKLETLAAMLAPALGAGQKVEPWLLKTTRSVYLDLGQGSGEQMFVTQKFGR